MRVSPRAASQALAAVRTTRRRAPGAHRRHGPARHRRSRRARGRLLATVPTPLSIDLALSTIDELPPLRAEVVEAAAARLAAGERPSSDDIAEMAIRRATCDLLR